MLLDSGICSVYKLVGNSISGSLELKSSHYYGEKTVGVIRYYEAKRSDSRIDRLIRVWRDESIVATDICVLVDGKQYEVIQAAHLLDENGLKVTDISLERKDRDYAIAEA